MASPGDAIVIAQTVTRTEDLLIDKSLTLTSQPGHTLTLTDFPLVRLWNPEPRSNTIVFEGIDLVQGRVSAVQMSSHPFRVTIRDLDIADTFNSGPMIQVRVGQPGPFGPVDFEVTNNRLTIPPASQHFGTDAIAIEGGNASSTAGVVRGNRIDHFDGGELGAISVYNWESNLDVDVIANQIRGADFNSGIQLYQFGPGISQVRILDNLVAGQTSQAGVPGSIVMNITEGDATFEIVNNTAVAGNRGIQVNGGSPIATWRGVVANNIVAGMGNNGIVIAQPATPGAVENDHNVIYNVPQNFFTPGPGTLFVDPLFVPGNSYRISDSSPARNSGNDSRVPADLVLDLDGNPRRVGHVDMGAYESTVTVSAPPVAAPEYRLESSVPNPFNPSTFIRYELPRAEMVRLGVFDARGALVRWLEPGVTREAGRHVAAWDGRDGRGVSMASGIYFYRITAGPFTASRRMVLLR